jgi:tripartite-type tricarboxylate transporter receptor subunit TctC
MRNHDAIVIGTGQSGPALALQDLVAGQIDLMFDNPITPLPYVRAGSIQSLCRHRQKPIGNGAQYPDRDEAGLFGFYASPVSRRAGKPAGHVKHRSRRNRASARPASSGSSLDAAPDR